MDKQNYFIKLSPEKAKNIIEETKDLVIIDVRTEAEHLYEGKLEESILIDFLKPRLFKKKILTLDKEKPYLIYCAVGRLSHFAAELMIELGFKYIYDLEGGLKNWQRNQNLVTTVSKLDDQEIIESRKNIITRLNKIEGQVKGMKKMLLEGEYCGDILNQSLAVKAALAGTNQEIMEMFFNTCINSVEQKNDFFKYLKKLTK
ncbi:metal-sensing transcriptional repressor [Fusobacterium sp. IOR10]|uniref:metal-sensing transcriptional repressor n=1 Tax=Fusobacterium sp. IOR10 TaxID=2665157 RepID=UPI0013CF77C6|nr:metal-sensing transcriptional repressor [Fusobacterium sp. IOR10]